MSNDHYTAFLDQRRLASGPLLEVATQLKSTPGIDATRPVLLFNDHTGRARDIDLSGSLDDVRARLRDSGEPGTADASGPAQASGKAKRGRPRLGVIPREVTLLPRHWEWLRAQPGGASVTLRKLVDEARRGDSASADRNRARDAAYHAMNALGGNLPGYEAALRALYGGDRAAFDEHIADWPADVRGYCRQLAAPAFAAGHPT